MRGSLNGSGKRRVGVRYRLVSDEGFREAARKGVDWVRMTYSVRRKSQLPSGMPLIGENRDEGA